MVLEPGLPIDDREGVAMKGDRIFRELVSQAMKTQGKFSIGETILRYRQWLAGVVRAQYPHAIGEVAIGDRDRFSMEGTVDDMVPIPVNRVSG